MICQASVDVDEAFEGLLGELKSKIASPDEFVRVRERLLRKKAKVNAEYRESVALRELIDEQRSAMQQDVKGEETGSARCCRTRSPSSCPPRPTGRRRGGPCCRTGVRYSS